MLILPLFFTNYKNMKTESTINKCNEETRENLNIDVNISDVILTPLTCASLVNEILKGLLYQKNQIPYPYHFLKSVVNKRRSKTESCDTKINFTVENHFRVVSTAYDSLQEVMKGISAEFAYGENTVKEIAVVFGTTPLSPSEVFSININNLATKHFERNHIEKNEKLQPKILRNIFLSQSWMNAIDGSGKCSNTYIFLRKQTSVSTNSTDQFLPIKQLTIPSKTKHKSINFHYNNEKHNALNCCDNLEVFNDVSQNCQQIKTAEIDNSENRTDQWFQSKGLIKGFKDCFINKVSVTQMW